MGTENIRTNTSARLFIGPASSAKTLAEFEAIVTAGTFVEIGLIEDMGEFGDESSMQMANPVGEGRQIPIKGSRNAGTQNLVVYQDFTDEGQLALIAAEKSPADFAFHFIDTDVPTGGGSPSERFYRAKVSSVRENRGNNDNIVRRTFALGITTEILLVPAEPTP